jgi:hypothetical protein
MDYTSTSDYKALEESLSMLTFFIKNADDLYNQFSKSLKNQAEAKKLKLSYEKYRHLCLQVEATCYQIFRDYFTLKESISKQGEILATIRPQLESLKQVKLIKQLDELSQNGLTISVPLMEMLADYYFAIMLPCLSNDISSQSIQRFTNTLIKAHDLIDEQLKASSKNNLKSLKEASQNYYNFSFILSNFFNKAQAVIDGASPSKT